MSRAARAIRMAPVTPRSPRRRRRGPGRTGRAATPGSDLAHSWGRSRSPRRSRSRRSRRAGTRPGRPGRSCAPGRPWWGLPAASLVLAAIGLAVCPPQAAPVTASTTARVGTPVHVLGWETERSIRGSPLARARGAPVAAVPAERPCMLCCEGTCDLGRPGPEQRKGDAGHPSDTLRTARAGRHADAILRTPRTGRPDGRRLLRRHGRAAQTRAGSATAPWPSCSTDRSPSSYPSPAACWWSPPPRCCTRRSPSRTAKCCVRPGDRPPRPGAAGLGVPGLTSPSSCVPGHRQTRTVVASAPRPR